VDNRKTREYSPAAPINSRTARNYRLVASEMTTRRLHERATDVSAVRRRIKSFCSGGAGRTGCRSASRIEEFRRVDALSIRLGIVDPLTLRRRCTGRSSPERARDYRVWHLSRPRQVSEKSLAADGLPRWITKDRTRSAELQRRERAPLPHDARGNRALRGNRRFTRTDTSGRLRSKSTGKSTESVLVLESTRRYSFLS